MTNRQLAIFSVCLLLLAAVAPTASAGATPGGNQFVIQSVTYAGAGVAKVGDNMTYLWRSAPHNETVTVYTGNRSGTHEVCTNFRTPGNDTTRFDGHEDVSGGILLP